MKTCGRELMKDRRTFRFLRRAVRKEKKTTKVYRKCCQLLQGAFPDWSPVEKLRKESQASLAT